MATLTLVRHGQASFGAANYDQLSALGQRQCEQLGRYLAGRGQRFDAVWRGTLQRHEQSLDALARGLGKGLPAATATAALNEYDSAAILDALHPGGLAHLGSPHTPEGYKQHFRLLREGLAAWMEGRIAPAGMPSHADFVAGIRELLAAVHAQRLGKVLIVSSGGPISTAVAAVLEAPASTAIELNMRLRNSALTELAATARGYVLHSFNGLPHLDSPEHADWMTYA